MSSDDRLLLIVQSVFGDDLSSLTDADGLNSVPGWDSVGHLDLIMAVEAEFEIEFEVDEFADLVTIGAIRRRLPEV